jgi:hypothetical protein
MLAKNPTSRRQPSPFFTKPSRQSIAAKYRLLKCVSGRTFFAKIELRLEPSDTNRVMASTQPGADSTPLVAPKNWIAAAERGARSALTHMARHNLIKGGWDVRIQQIIGSVSDTTPDAIACAAGMAIWIGLLSNCARPEVTATTPLRLKWPSVLR